MNGIKRLSSGLILMVAVTIVLGGCGYFEPDYRQKIRDAGLEWNRADFIQEVEAGEVEHVKWFLRGGMDPNIRDRNGRPLVTTAVNGESTEVLELLIKHQADLEMKDSKGRTPLYHGASGSVEMVRLLTEHGADVEAEQQYGYTPLINASSRGLVDVVKALLEAGATVDHADDAGGTPLIYASERGHTEVVRILLENGADPNAHKTNNNTALTLSTWNGHLDVVKRLIENGADIHERGRNQWTPLMSASARGHTDVVKYLLDQGSDVNASSVRHGTALGKAGGYGYWRIVGLLKEAGADTVSLDEVGSVPHLRNPDSFRDYRRFLNAERNRAFAVSPSGAWGWSRRFDTPEKARSKALEFCQQDGADCDLYAVNDRILWQERYEQRTGE